MDNKRRAAYRRTFTSETGKEVLHDILASCHVFHSTFTPDPQVTAFQEGKRAAALRIMAMMELRPEELQEIANMETAE